MTRALSPAVEAEAMHGALDRLAAFRDGTGKAADFWMVDDAYDVLHRALIGPTFTDEEYEARSIADCAERWSEYLNVGRVASVEERIAALRLAADGCGRSRE